MDDKCTLICGNISLIRKVELNNFRNINYKQNNFQNKYTCICFAKTNENFCGK